MKQLQFKHRHSEHSEESPETARRSFTAFRMTSLFVTIVFIAVMNLFLPSHVFAFDAKALTEKLVNINSSSANPQGLDAVRAVLIPEFEKLGYKATTVAGDKNKVVYFSVPGTKPQLVLMGHVDTVFAKDSPFQKFKASGAKWFGPGVSDMKGGLSLILNVLHDLSEAERKNIAVIINDDEEIGSPFSKNVYGRWVKNLKGVLVFEPPLADGSLVDVHAGIQWLTISAKGRAAHAGFEPQAGTNACVALASKLKEIQELSRYADGVSVNPGVIRGGTKANVICENAQVDIDIRFRKLTELKEIEEKIATILKEKSLTLFNPKFPVIFGIKKTIYLPPLSEENSKDLLNVVKKTGEGLQIQITNKPAGYGSDAGHLSGMGVKVLAGLGLPGGGIHSEREFVDVKKYNEKLNLVTETVKNLLTQH